MATVPAEITWVAGSIVTAAQLNLNLRDGINFFVNPVIAVLRQTVAQSLTSAVFTSINMDTEDIDRDGGHSTVTNTSRYTAQTAGWYEALACVHYSANVTGRRITRWAVNAAALLASFTSMASVATGTGSTGMDAVPRRVFLNVGDFLEVQGFQDSGGALNTQVGAENASYFSVLWVSS